MYKYFYTLNADGTINSLIKAKKCSNGVQISKADYEKYLSITTSIPQKEGYDLTIHLYPDFTYSVEYTPIEIIEVNDEE